MNACFENAAFWSLTSSIRVYRITDKLLLTLTQLIRVRFPVDPLVLEKEPIFPGGMLAMPSGL